MTDDILKLSDKHEISGLALNIIAFYYAARADLEEENKRLREAVVAMAEDGWLSCGVEGLDEAQQKCLDAYALIKPTPPTKEPPTMSRESEFEAAKRRIQKRDDNGYSAFDLYEEGRKEERDRAVRIVEQELLHVRNMPTVAEAIVKALKGE